MRVVPARTDASRRHLVEEVLHIERVGHLTAERRRSVHHWARGGWTASLRQRWSDTGWQAWSGSGGGGLTQAGRPGLVVVVAV